jgi:hypothetical protein
VTAAEVLEYTDPRPHCEKGRVRIALMQLYAEHRAAGMLPTSCRFLFYELVTRKVIAKGGKLRPDQVVIKALVDLREQGLIPWEHIVDETREVMDFTGSETVADDLMLYLHSARLDPWEGNPPLILTESRSLAGVLRRLCSRYRCRIASTNGQVGGFLRTKVAPLLVPDARVGYLGDYDLCGGMIEDNTRRVLESEVGELDWRRLALTKDQVAEYDLPTITKSDRRFINGEGDHEAVETEALSQSLIVEIVRDWLDSLLPQPLETIHASEEEQREALRRLIEEMTP